MAGKDFKMDLKELVEGLPEVYQPIYNHPDLSKNISRVCQDRLKHIDSVYSALAKRMQRPLKVLDLGAAQGYFSFNLAKIGANVQGVDYSAENIAVCNKLASEFGDLDVCFQCCRIEELIPSIKKGQYDLVLGLSVFHHVIYDHGISAVTEMLGNLASKVEVGLFEFAQSSEPLYWAESQPGRSSELLNSFAFSHELSQHGTHLSTILRPLYFASNNYWYLNSKIELFDSMTLRSHSLSNNVHQGTRRYYFNDDCFMKKFSLDIAQLKSRNLEEFNNEVKFLDSAPSNLNFPRLISYGHNEKEAWILRSKLPGELLLNIMQKGGAYNQEQILDDVLKQLISLEEVGLYHSDLRVWNILVNSEGGASLIDFGSISSEVKDCAAPHDLFVSFSIFVHEVTVGITDYSALRRSPILASPPFLEGVYKNWMISFWEKPSSERSFQLLHELFLARYDILEDYGKRELSARNLLHCIERNWLIESKKLHDQLLMKDESISELNESSHHWWLESGRLTSHWSEKQSEWSEKESEWSEKQSEWSEKESEWSKKESEWSKKESEWSEKESEWSEKQSHWSEKESEWSEKESQWSEKESQWSGKVAQIAEVEATNLDLTSKINELNLSSNHWWRAAQKLECQLSDKDERIAELNESSHHWYLESEKFRLALQSIYDSKSWIVTWPLRRLSVFIKWLCILPVRVNIRLIRFIKRIFNWLLGKVMTLQQYPRLYNFIRSLSHAFGFKFKASRSYSEDLPEDSLLHKEMSKHNAFASSGEFVFPKSKKERKIYYYVDHTIQCPVNTGMQRVVRQLGKALLNSGENITFVKWNSDENMFELLSPPELEFLSQWNGPQILNKDSARYHGGNSHSPILIKKHLLEECNWLIVPEVTYITPHPVPMTLEIIVKAKECGLKTAFIFYDALPLRRPEFQALAENHAVYMQQLMLSDLVVPISHWSCRDLSSYLIHHEYAAEMAMPMIKTVVLPGASARSKRITSSVSSNKLKNFILSVGTMEQRKNQLMLVHAFEHFCDVHPDSDLNLVLVGSISSEIRQSLDTVVKRCKRIRVIEGVSDDKLDKLYRDCLFTVFPSIAEGFGLPILESLWYGKPCICANFGSMLEVAQEGGCLTIDTKDSHNIFKAIDKISTDPCLWSKLSTEALERKIEDWNDYSDRVLLQMDTASDPLRTVGNIYYLIDHTSRFPGNTGIQRIVRGLAKSLMDNGLSLIPVMWDDDKKMMLPAIKQALKHVSNWNGPSVDQWHEWRNPEDARSQDWFLVPELTHLRSAELISYSQRLQLRSAYIFYDAIPWKMKNLYPTGAVSAHEEYMGDINSCEKIFAISQFSRNDLLDFLSQSSLSTPDLENRIDACVLPGEFMETPRVTEIKRGKSGFVKVLCVGTIEPRKNHLVLMEAFRQVQLKTTKHVELIIAGMKRSYPSLNEELEDYIDSSSRITWEKSPDDTRLRELYEECDFTVYPSIEEGFGLPILESLWHARPCICRNHGAMEEVAQAGGCLTADVMSKDALSDAILKLIEDDLLRYDLARQSLKIKFKTWLDYGREVATRLARERFVTSDETEK